MASEPSFVSVALQTLSETNSSPSWLEMVGCVEVAAMIKNPPVVSLFRDQVPLE